MSGNTTAVDGEANAGGGTPGRTDAQGCLETTLDSVRRNASELLAGVASPPSLLRVSAGEVTIELEWRSVETPLASAPPAPAAQAAVTGGAVAAAPPAGTGADSGHHHITAPIVGVYYHAPEPGARPFVEPGTRVSPGQQVGIVEAMKMMIPVEADRAGTVVEVLVPNGTAVEFGERLIALDVSGG